MLNALTCVGDCVNSLFKKFAAKGGGMPFMSRQSLICEFLGLSFSLGSLTALAQGTATSRTLPFKEKVVSIDPQVRPQLAQPEPVIDELKLKLESWAQDILMDYFPPESVFAAIGGFLPAHVSRPTTEAPDLWVEIPKFRIEVAKKVSAPASSVVVLTEEIKFASHSSSLDEYLRYVAGTEPYKTFVRKCEELENRPKLKQPIELNCALTVPNVRLRNAASGVYTQAKSYRKPYFTKNETMDVVNDGVISVGVERLTVNVSRTNWDLLTSGVRYTCVLKAPKIVPALVVGAEDVELCADQLLSSATNHPEGKSILELIIDAAMERFFLIRESQ